ncbi:recombinase RecT [Streptomyces sp. NBC_00101]|uniref:recombinase RecT n=1 Tax=Streptomyces sp. NBC_00101 TaxID=2975651 RepID=UPI00324DAB14
MTENVTQAIAVRDNGPAAQIEQYRDEYAALMPSHVNPDQWVRMAVGAIRGDVKLVQAAQNDIGAFLRELRTAARLGLEPGTEQFYLTPRKTKGRVVIKGIVGYQGIVELIYRAGAVSSVIVEVVRTHDTFRYVIGRDGKPVHEIDWFGDDRGDMVGVYAYAVMKDGATSKVVVLNRRQVMEAKAKSDSRNSEYSPWNTNEESMWLKTAVRRLAKWVPTSAEYMREQLRAQAEVAGELTGSASAPLPPQPSVELDDEDDGPIDGELEPEGGWPDVAQPGTAA